MIVGAGIAGLATARLLVEDGRSVTVLESRDRVGGRLLSEPVSGGALDLGATWFWEGEHRVARLVDELGVNVHPQHLSGDAMFQPPTGAVRIDGNPIDVPAHRFSTGAQGLPAGLAEQLPSGTIQLGATVERVVAGASLTIEHSRGRIIAQHVVLALAPALVVARIEFDPPLPERLRGIAEVTPVWMGNTIKVVAQYERPFWREQGLSGSAMSHVGPMREIHDMSGPSGDPAALFGFVPSTGVGAPTPDEIEEQLEALFGSEARKPLKLLITDWSSDADTSPPGVDRLGAYQLFGHELYQQPALDGRLHWASTETARFAPGHIEGALAAAERAASTIADHPST